MEQLVNEIRPGYADRVINEKLAALRSAPRMAYTKHFNQNEEYFVEVDQPFTVPSFPIHHDVRHQVPRTDYSTALRDYIGQLLPLVPDFFSDLTYFFDPAEIQKPCFYRLYKVGEAYFLYLMRLNLQFRPLEAELLQRGTNDASSAYRTRRLYFESDFIPLASVLTEMGRVVAFTVKQTISQTWIGETGKGYLVRGIWMDMELTKFFSKLFLPAGLRSYPFYPFTCKYKTVCMFILDPTPDNRRKLLPLLHAALSLVGPDIDRIQEALKTTPFSEDLPIFAEMKARVSDGLVKAWQGLKLTSYLNGNEQKEFTVEF